MKRRTFLKTVASASLAGLVSANTRKASGKTNIIFILADDLGYGDLGCYGQKAIRTPEIDGLAREGIRFTQFYAGSTVCAPSRCVLMTGQHTGHCWVRGNAGQTNPTAQALRPNDATVARLLQQAGYTTALIGKWGLGDVGPAETGLPRRHGFDTFFGYLNQRHAHNYYPTYLFRNEDKVPLHNVVPDEDAQGAGVASVRAEYSADLIADEALAFIRREKDRPFFLYFAPTLPHANNEAKDKGMEVPDLGDYARLDWAEPQKGHAAMIHRLDRSVGRILGLLKELGLDGRTIVFFSSDNGPHREGGYDPDFNDSNGPLRGIKRDLYEGGIRVPMIVRWPGRIKAGRISNHVSAFWDFLPTACDLAEVPTPKGLDGISYVPELLGKHQTGHDDLYWEFHERRTSEQAIRRGRWKAVRHSPSGPIELYDLEKDIGEQINVAARHPDIVKKMDGRFRTARGPNPAWPLKDE